MNKPRCQFDKRKNCRCFAFCSPSPKTNAQQKPTVKSGSQPCILLLTVGACAVPQTKATGCKNTSNTALQKTTCSPEQKKKPKAICVCVGNSNTKAVASACGRSERACPRSAALHGLVFADTLGLKAAVVSITTTAFQKIKKGETNMKMKNEIPDLTFFWFVGSNKDHSKKLLKCNKCKRLIIASREETFDTCLFCKRENAGSPNTDIEKVRRWENGE